MTKFFVILTIISLFLKINGGPLTAQQMFGKYMSTYRLAFNNTEDETIAYDTFQSNLEYINGHNSDNKSFTLGLNQFSHYVGEILIILKEFKIYLKIFIFFIDE